MRSLCLNVSSIFCEIIFLARQSRAGLGVHHSINPVIYAYIVVGICILVDQSLLVAIVLKVDTFFFGFSSKSTVYLPKDIFDVFS